MKNLINLALVAAVYSTASFGLVREMAACTTADGHYEVNVTDNQGIGPVRTSHFSATIRDLTTDQIVAAYKVEPYNSHSISFGRQSFRDTETLGENFLIAGPSTNFRHYSLHAELNAGGASDTISDDGLKCTVFNGVVLHHR